MAREPHRAALELRSLLVRFPYWRDGHLHLAQVSLQEKDLATAYASTQCFRALVSGRSSAKLESQGRHLLGRCFLAAGDPAQALDHLRMAKLLSPLSGPIAEDEAAALMALGRNSEAAQTLADIPPDNLSFSGSIALGHLKK